MSQELCQRIAQRLERRMTEAGLPSVAFAIAQHGRIIHEQALGYADREKQIPATPQTLYTIASITKPLTCMALMKLVDRGQLDLDQPVNRYLSPDAPVPVWIGRPEDLTVRRVANHTGGLPTYAHYFLAGEPLSSLDESISRYANVVVPPGERYTYSNIGYAVLARVIERISGQTYAQFMEREIFRPLGMQHAAIASPATHSPLAATPYNWEDKPTTLQEITATDHAAASCAMCSIHDLIRLGLFHLGHRQSDQAQVLSPQSIAAMQQNPFPVRPSNFNDFNIRPDSRYAIGWVMDDDALDTRISHAGGMDGCSSKLLILPREQLVIALLTNVFNKTLYTLENDILEMWDPSYVDRLAAYRQRLANMPVQDAPAAELLQKLPGRWRGEVHTYEGRMPLALTFTSLKEAKAQFHNQDPTDLRDWQYSGLRMQAQFNGLLPTSDANTRTPLPGHSLKLDLHLRGNRLCGALYSLRGNMLNHWLDLARVD